MKPSCFLFLVFKISSAIGWCKSKDKQITLLRLKGICWMHYRNNWTKKCIPLSSKAIIKRNNIAYKQKKKFWVEVNNYHGPCPNCIWNGFHPFKNSLTQVLLKTLPAWEQVESYCVMLKRKGIKIDSGDCVCVCVCVCVCMNNILKSHWTRDATESWRMEK